MNQEDLIGQTIFTVEVVVDETVSLEMFAVETTAEARATEHRAMGYDEVYVTPETIK